MTGLKHIDGAVSMARGSADSATSGWFICINDQPSLDFGGKRNPDGQGFAAFGRVVSGMDVVRQDPAGAVVGEPHHQRRGPDADAADHGRQGRARRAVDRAVSRTTAIVIVAALAAAMLAVVIQMRRAELAVADVVGRDTSARAPASITETIARPRR